MSKDRWRVSKTGELFPPRDVGLVSVAKFHGYENEMQHVRDKAERRAQAVVDKLNAEA